ncbi:glycosyltransferase family 4 protein [Paenibacillus sp. NPDC058071]|uniref:glycosyltransferase family 4 protein n=1 Tax=Paenibacillus sp. NPDC058071 TaxID=3346326 RepID=UPI0036D7EFB7
MKVLTTGLGWNEWQPGGLNRYYADYNQALKEHGHTAIGLIAGGKREELSAGLSIKKAANADAPILSRMWSFRRHAASIVADQKPDVFNPHFALYASMISRDLLPDHIPIVTHFHGPWAMESNLEESGTPFLVREARYRMKKRIELATYRRSDRFIVLSDYFRKMMIEHYGIDGERIDIVPGAVEHERFAPAVDRLSVRQKLGVQEHTSLLFCVRRIVRRMGIDRLIEAMSEVAEHCPHSRLVIAGEGPMRGEYEQLIAERRLTGRVQMVGRVSNEQLVEWYQAADISVVPTVTLEGFGLVTVESLSCGTPAMGTPYGGTKEILSGLSGDLLFDDGSPQAMARQLVKALKGELQLPTREECHEFVLRNYTWSQVARSVTEVLEDAAERRKRQ